MGLLRIKLKRSVCSTLLSKDVDNIVENDANYDFTRYTNCYSFYADPLKNFKNFERERE